jgi:hypothetical protein
VAVQLVLGQVVGGEQVADPVRAGVGGASAGPGFAADSWPPQQAGRQADRACGVRDAEDREVGAVGCALPVVERLAEAVVVRPLVDQGMPARAIAAMYSHSLLGPCVPACFLMASVLPLLPGNSFIAILAATPPVIASCTLRTRQR